MALLIFYKQFIFETFA